MKLQKGDVVLCQVPMPSSQLQQFKLRPAVIVSANDINQILESFKRRNINMPNAIIAKTIKGKGVSFMENNKDWHHNILSRLQYELAIEELNDRNK